MDFLIVLLYFLQFLEFYLILFINQNSVVCFINFDICLFILMSTQIKSQKSMICGSQCRIVTLLRRNSVYTNLSVLIQRIEYVMEVSNYSFLKIVVTGLET